MKAPDRQPLSEMLRRVADAPSPPPAEVFWEDFRARAAITDQVGVEQVERVSSLWLSWRTGLAAAAALVVVSALLVLQIPRDTIVAAAPPPAEGSLSEVEEVEVFSDYSSVLIVEDEENGGTVIWIAGTDVASVP